jgi:tetratricopeptide (TPR) repeat protein
VAVNPTVRPTSRRIGARLAGLLLLPVLACAVSPRSAEAVLLWKRKGGPKEAPPTAAGSPEAAVDTASAQAELVATLVAQATATLGAPDRIPTPAEAANYPHELRSLSAAWPSVEPTDGARQRALALLRYGNALANLNRDPEAARAYADALALDPGLQAAGVNMGSLLRRAGELELSESICRQLVALNPRAGTAWYNLAVTLQDLGDWDGADAAYLEALKWSPQLWLPTHNPLIVGNQRARYAIHRNYLAGSVRGSIFLDDAR